MTVEKQAISILKEQGYKLTPQRKAILGVINRNRRNMTPAVVYERVRRHYPGIGLVTVYRTLELLTRLGCICEVHTGDNSRSYLLRRSSGHHHHLMCSGCNRVMDFTDCDLTKMERRIAKSTGFRIESHLVEFVGQCSKCQAGTAVKC
ncbi:Fur family transcriptional regulator [Chloroflexota bacterium]